MPDYFCELNPGDNTPNACTPKIDLNFIGIKINTPTKVKFPLSMIKSTDKEDLIIPLCGVYRFSFAYIVKLDSPQQRMSIIIVNNKIHKSYSGKMQDPNIILEDPNPIKINMDNADNRYEGGFFNINILDHVTFPLMEAEYDIHIVLEEHKSNVVTIKILGSNK